MAAVTKFPVVKTSVVGPTIDVSVGILPIAGDIQDSVDATDIKLIEFANGFDVQLGVDGDFDLIDGLDTSLKISVLAEQRLAEDEEPVSVNRGGWLGNQFSEESGFEIGSKVWLYYGNRLTLSTLNGIKDKSILGLNWLINKNIAIAVDASTSRSSRSDGNLNIAVTRPDGTVQSNSLKLWNSTPDR